jgi:hypothetical protein
MDLNVWNVPLELQAFLNPLLALNAHLDSTQLLLDLSVFLALLDSTKILLVLDLVPNAQLVGFLTLLEMPLVLHVVLALTLTLLELRNALCAQLDNTLKRPSLPLVTSVQLEVSQAILDLQLASHASLEPPLLQLARPPAIFVLPISMELEASLHAVVVRRVKPALQVPPDVSEFEVPQKKYNYERF